MKIELHLLQNFAPSNLNRDDTGAPKDCEFGGHRRARISSQCQKRAVRDAFRVDVPLPSETLAVRTKRLAEHVAEAIHKHDPAHAVDEALKVAVLVMQGQGLGFPLPGGEAAVSPKKRSSRAADDDDADTKSQYLLLLPTRRIDEFARIASAHWSPLVAASATWDYTVSKANKKSGPKRLRSVAGEAADQLEPLFRDTDTTVDLALFGRMIADRPEWNVEACCQVAHAISTNKVQMDFDFFTAVDDLKKNDTAASDMMGTVQFNSSCFYRYAVLDVAALTESLGIADATKRAALVKQGVDAFVRAFTVAIPTGKQNTFAAHNFPSYALAVVREKGQPIALTNAFLKPARPRGEDIDLVDDSIAKLEDYFARLSDAVGPAKTTSWGDRDLSENTKIHRASRLDDFFTEATSLATGSA
jgi:CRISPR system Cascade subunit CasC